MSALANEPDRAAFIREHTRLLPVPHAPEIALHVAEEATELWQKTEDELAVIGLPPPFWAFAWAGGQALARYLLDHPHAVAGRRVLDFASGSGLVAIAAMKAGAVSVEACDIDAFAATAIGLNAQANGVPVELVHRVIVRESRYNPALVGRGGTIGLMQIKLATARGLGYTGTAAGLRDPETNLTYAVKYLAGAYRAAGGNHNRAVAYYAGGYYYAAKRQRLAHARHSEPLVITPVSAQE